MYPTLEELTEVMKKSAEIAKDYGDKHKPRSYSGGKARVKEVAKDVEMLTALIDEAEAEKNIFASCKEGCNACCKQAIPMSRFNADNIMNYVKQNYDKQTLDALKIRIDAAARILDDTFGKRPTNEVEAKAFMGREVENKEKYFDLQLMCPLNENGRCMAYPVRPSSCWSYRVYGDPADCESSFDVPHSITHGAEHYQVLKVRASMEAGAFPRYLSYYMPSFLPQKLSEIWDDFIS